MQICEQFNLVNIFHRLYPEHENFKTYRQGTKVIDFALALPSIADAVTNFVYKPFLYRLKGDHRAFFFDIPESALFGNNSLPPFDTNARGFHSKDVKNATVYLQTVSEYLGDQNIFVCLQRLISLPELDMKEVEDIDRTLTKA